MRISNLITSLLVVIILLPGCKKAAFVELNTDPSTLYSVLPEEQFLNAPYFAQYDAFESAFDFKRQMMPWSQMLVDLEGNGENFLINIGNFNTRFKSFYPDLGASLTDVQHLIDQLPEDKKAARVYLGAMAEIVKIYYGFYVSDINGSIVYSEGFQARYGGTLTPKYETQKELFSLWNTRLKEIVTVLKTPQPTEQVSMAEKDLYYHGNIDGWIKAATALRLRIAMRLLKRDPEQLKSIAADVLSDASALMASNDDSWGFKVNELFTEFSDWRMDEKRAPKPSVDFMWNNSDPRIRLFYQKNNYSPENLQLAIDKGTYPPGTTWNPRQFIGGHTSPDSSAGPYLYFYFTKRINDTLTLDTVSLIQSRLFRPFSFYGPGVKDYGPGNGTSVFVYLTYADLCFMRAELAARGMTSEDPELWYKNGIRASVEYYDKLAAEAKIFEYVPVVSSEIDAYLLAPDIVYNPAKGLEQIVIQAYLNFFKEPNEAWAIIKRTGMPNKNTKLANEDISINGSIKQIPRRAQIDPADPASANYENQKAAQDEMASDPDFGEGLSDFFGRVWWDKK